MKDSTDPDILLLGYAGFEAAERFLCSLGDRIHVLRREAARSAQVTVELVLVPDAEAMCAQLARGSQLTVLSAHAAHAGERLGFAGEGKVPPFLACEEVGAVGARSALVLDTCVPEGVFQALGERLAPGIARLGLAYAASEQSAKKEPRDETVFGRDSVMALGAFFDELCVVGSPKLDLAAVGRALELANVALRARNAQRGSRAEIKLVRRF